MSRSSRKLARRARTRDTEVCPACAEPQDRIFEYLADHPGTEAVIALAAEQSLYIIPVTRELLDTDRAERGRDPLAIPSDYIPVRLDTDHGTSWLGIRMPKETSYALN